VKTGWGEIRFKANGIKTPLAPNSRIMMARYAWARNYRTQRFLSINTTDDKPGYCLLQIKQGIAPAFLCLADNFRYALNKSLFESCYKNQAGKSDSKLTATSLGVR
jgi:hypothetical protein